MKFLQFQSITQRISKLADENFLWRFQSEVWMTKKNFKWLDFTCSNLLICSLNALLNPRLFMEADKQAASLGARSHLIFTSF